MLMAARWTIALFLFACVAAAWASEPAREPELETETGADAGTVAEFFRYEVIAANPFKEIERRAAEAAERKERERREREEAERLRREAELAYLEAEWIAANPESFIRHQNELIKQLQGKLEAQSGELMKIEKSKDEQAAKEKEQLDALKKEIEELRKLVEDQQKKRDESEAALQKENEELKKRLDGAASERASIARSSQHVINVIRERILRDFETQVFDGIEFVRIPAGAFTMGASDAHAEELKAKGVWSDLNQCETPAHRVTISKPFFISKREITQKEWKALISKNPSAFDGDDLPVESVTWGEANDFIKKLEEKSGGKYRLPTEAEWEYCARAGGDGLFGAGAGGEAITFDNLDDYAWTAANSENKTQPAGGKKPNAWGLHDMAGNVWEWCLDWHDCDYYANSPEADPRASDGGTERVFRGGAYGLEPQHSRPSTRGGNLPDFSSPYVGFRVVREIERP